ncbi:MAG: acyltransferase [Candidatus Sulfotelmatobacter sp.]|jgi:peptidoglycan/LPS O-acetylase OafA/YrhL
MPSAASQANFEATPLLRPKMPELDSLRGVAILMVLLYHGFASRQDFTTFSGFPKFFVLLASPGWTGVNLFFALSGFLITGILLDTKHHPHYYRRFYRRRALRILPAYYALLLLLAIFGRYGTQGETVSWAFLGMSAVYLANVTALFGVPAQFGVLWSLAVEEHFYLIWPVVVRNVRQHTVVLAAVVISGGATLARIIAWRLGRDCFAHYTWFVADGLAFGSLLAVLMRGQLGTRKGLKLISVAALLGSALLLAPDLLLHGPLAGGSLHITALNLLCSALVGCALLVGTSPWSFLLQHRSLRFFGEISYGLYLLHMLVFNVFDNLQQQFLPRLPSFKGHFGAMVTRFLICGGLAVAWAFLSRRYFEEPFLRLKDREASHPADVAPEATAA